MPRALSPTALSAVLPVLLLTALLLGVAVPPAAAHTEIAATVPEAGSRVADPPVEVEVTFAGDVQPGSVQARVVDPAGDDLVAGEVVLEGRVARIPLNPAVVEGVHTVDVAFTAADGDDQVETFTFVYAPPAAVASPTEVLTGPPVQPATPTAPPTATATPTPTPTPSPTATASPAATPTDTDPTDTTPSPSVGSTADEEPLISRDAGVGALPAIGLALLVAVGAVALVVVRMRHPDQDG